MPEMSRADPIARLHEAPTPSGGVLMRPIPPTAQFLLRAGPDGRRLASEAFGVNIPDNACRSGSAGNRASLWLGPAEFLLLAAIEDAGTIEHALSTALKPVHHALVDVGHRNVAMEISGRHAARVLNAGCPLDLDNAAFPIGACTRTILGKVEIVLWRNGYHTFYVAMWRSFAAYVWRYLDEARIGEE